MGSTDRYVLGALLSVLMAGMVATTVRAQETVSACVICMAPARTYACEVLLPEQGTMAQSPQLFCASELANANGHKSCLVVRSAETACDGERITLAYTGPIANPEPLEPETPAQPKANIQPPKTLVEATDRAIKSTGRQIKKAGDAVSEAGKTVGSITKSTGKKIKDTGTSVGQTVGKAAKSTWDCIVSLFQSC